MKSTDALLRLYEAERNRLRRAAKDARHAGERLLPVFGEGSMAPHLMLIGEAPGARETLEGKPFAGKAGNGLDGLLAAANITRAEIYLTNAVKFRPTRVKPNSVANRAPTLEEVKEGLPLLGAELRILRPRVVATLGNTPLGAIALLAGAVSMRVGEVHGRPMKIRVEEHAFVLFPLYHPASVLYNPALRSVLQGDFSRLSAFVKGEETAL